MGRQKKLKIDFYGNILGRTTKEMENRNICIALKDKCNVKADFKVKGYFEFLKGLHKDKADYAIITESYGAIKDLSKTYKKIVVVYNPLGPLSEDMRKLLLNNSVYQIWCNNNMSYRYISDSVDKDIKVIFSHFGLDANQLLTDVSTKIELLKTGNNGFRRRY